MASYRALVGLEFNDTRVEAGEETTEIPATSLKWLLDGGHIELVETNSGVKVGKSKAKDASTENPSTEDLASSALVQEIQDPPAEDPEAEAKAGE